MTDLGTTLRRLADACKAQRTDDLVALAGDLAQADVACLMLCDDAGILRPLASVPAAPEPGLLTRIGQLGAEVMASDRPLLLPEEAATPDLSPPSPLAGIGRVAILPVKGERTRGVLVLLGGRGDASSTCSAFLEPLAQLTGCVLDSFQLAAADDEASRLSLILRRTARVLRRAETVPEILSAAVREATEEVSAAAGVVFYWDDDANAFQLASAWARSQRQLRFLNSLSWERTPALKRVKANREPVLVDSTDRQMLPEGLSPALGDGTMVAAPVVFEERLLGALLVGPIDRASVGCAQVEVLKGIGRQLGAGIQNIRMEDGLKKLETKLESELIRSQLLSMVSHELRTPLTSIKGYATTLLRYYDRLPNRERIEFIRYIGEASDRLNSLLDDLLDTSKLEAGLIAMEKTKVDMGELIQRCVSEFQLRGTGHKLVTDVAMGLPEVVADGRRIRQVLSNLLDNAIKYSDPLDTIAISCRLGDKALQVSVCDHGPGIPTEHLPRIFEPFYQVEQSPAEGKGGAGLGLAICQRLVQAHSGRIWAESRPGEGSTFFFTLPLPPSER